MKVKVIFYSMYGHIYRMAEAVAQGANEVQGADCSQCRLSKDVKLSIEAAAPGTVLSEIMIQVGPCLLITEITRMM